MLPGHIAQDLGDRHLWADQESTFNIKPRSCQLVDRPQHRHRRIDEEPPWIIDPFQPGPLPIGVEELSHFHFIRVTSRVCKVVRRRDTTMSSSSDAVTSQGQRRATESLQRLLNFITNTAHTLNLITRAGDGMTRWGHKAFKSLREALYPIISHPEKYSMRSGDQRPDDDINTTGRTCPPLTPGYIEAIAKHRNLDTFADEPVLQVLNSTMSFESNSSRSTSRTNLIHFTHLRLADGSNNQVLCRLNMHLTHDGKRLQPGDVIMLTRYSPMLYSPSGESNPQRSPAIVVHQFTRVGYTSISEKLQPPLHCPDSTELEQSTRLTDPSPVVASTPDGNEYEENVQVECTPENRCCSLYGLSMVVCICDFDPVKEIDLDELRQYCWFAERDVVKMTNK